VSLAMSYYLRFSGKSFYINLIAAGLLVFIFIRYCWVGRRHDAFDYFAPALFVGYMLFIHLPRYVKFLYFVISKRPVLEVTDLFLFDHYKNIKYYWDDIELINASDSKLMITLYEPPKYFKEIVNPFSRFRTRILFQLYNETSLFKIDLGVLELKKSENQQFMNMLDELSLAGKN